MHDYSGRAAVPGTGRPPGIGGPSSVKRNEAADSRRRFALAVRRLRRLRPIGDVE